MMKTYLTGAALIAVSIASLSTAFAEPGDRPGRPGMPPFEMLDADEDGRITAEEAEGDRAERVTAMDANNDGKISAEELAAADIARATERANRRAEEKVKRMDVDGDGLLSAAELATPPEGLDPRLLERLDTDKDGAISREEADAARTFMRERHQPHPDHRPE
ncbi:EF-hand domain-containing protein [Falsirhodobacter sp. 20TX0035]|uniref:EF-hand domain-containing protein n=1 Tax=Falsirhodobacter sp. 20TX0035 TaxID=3022019 RepID=UPI00232B1C39|nr:histidine kinase [Falsirhodobacter sp. 20TX0035]MDB6452393.1 histidine kinase [Falsirhodobacter sp. 20TX0035]